MKRMVKKPAGESGKAGRATAQRIQKRMILDFLGESIANQPKAIGELDEMIRLAKLTKPEEFKRAVDIVVNKKLPDVAPATPAQEKRELSYADWRRIVSELMDEYEGGAIKKAESAFDSRVAAIAAGLQEELGDQARGLVKQLQEAIVAESKKYNRIEVKVGNRPVVKFENEIVPEEFKQLLRLAASRKNILMVGPSGCGKTHVAGMLAKAMGLPYASQSCSAGVSESAFVGWLIPIKNGEFVHVPSQFVKLYEEGGVFLFDEMDASDPNVLVFINQALANDHFFLPQRFDKPKVVKHKDFIAVAAANTYGTGADAMYTARNALDAATLDRFKIGTVAMDYSATVEQALVEPTILEWSRAMRKVITKHRMRKIMSTRVMLDGTDMMRDHEDYTLESFKEAYFMDWTPEERRIAANEMGGAL